MDIVCFGIGKPWNVGYVLCMVLTIIPASIQGPLGKHLWNTSLAELMGDTFTVVSVFIQLLMLRANTIVHTAATVYHAGNRIGDPWFYQACHIPFLPRHLLASHLVP